MKVRILILVLGALALLTLGRPALTSAQGPDKLTSLTINVWPEFDDPRVLVQYDGQLAAKDGYPRDVSVYVPATAAVAATAYADESQQLLNTDPPTIKDASNGLKLVTIKLPKPNFHIEYYDDAIKGAPDKTLDFTYTAFQPADQVSFKIQQPLKAEKFTTAPAAALVSEGMHDFKYHIFNYPGIAANQALKVQVSYTKTDPNPSIQNVVPPATSEQPVTDTAAATDTALGLSTQQLAILLGAAVVLALGLLALWMWFTRRQPRLALAGLSSGNSKGDRATGGFCGQCGSALHAGDHFCPKCGAKRK